jgi:hypothetical protein
MELTDPKEMERQAEDIRRMEKPFIAQATSVFEALFSDEYRRMRAAALESGESTIVLNVTVRCNFSPDARSVEMQTSPVPVMLKPRRRAVVVNPPK